MLILCEIVKSNLGNDTNKLISFANKKKQWTMSSYIIVDYLKTIQLTDTFNQLNHLSLT